MKTDAEQPESKQPGEALTKVLNQSEEAKGLVKEAAAELSSVNADLKQELVERDAPAVIASALKKNAPIEVKVHQAAEMLSGVNMALKIEVQEQVVLNIQLATVIEREEETRYIALHDVLTGLPNRALFNDRLEHGLAQAKRQGWNLAVMFIDLDDFKIINDSYGHDSGDCVLKSIALRLREMTRDDDTISRYGGDEFLYLLTEVMNEQTLMSIAEKIIASIEAPCIISAAGKNIHLCVSASLGIAMFPQHGTTAETLIKSADMAMYQAKGSKMRYAFAE